jgi:hypothetical protein
MMFLQTRPPAGEEKMPQPKKGVEREKPAPGRVCVLLIIYDHPRRHINAVKFAFLLTIYIPGRASGDGLWQKRFF